MFEPSFSVPFRRVRKWAFTELRHTVTGEKRLFRLAEVMLSRSLSWPRALVWGKPQLPWHELATPLGTQRTMRFDAVLPTPVDVRDFRSSNDIEDCLTCIVVMPAPDIVPPDPKYCWRGRTWSSQERSFATGLMARQQVSLPDLADALNRLRLSPEQREQDLANKLFALDFAAAEVLAVDLDRHPPQPSALAGLGISSKGSGSPRATGRRSKAPAPGYCDVLTQFIIVARSHSPQVAARWILQHRFLFAESVAGGVTRRLFGLKTKFGVKPKSRVKPKSGDISAGAFANGLRSLEQTAQRALHTGFGVSAKGSPRGKNSGQWPKPVSRPMNGVKRLFSRKKDREEELTARLTSGEAVSPSQRAQLTDERDTLANERKERARLARQARKSGLPHAQKIALLGHNTGVYLDLQYQLRSEAVRLTIREAIGAAQAAAIDTAKVDSFRLLTGGLTRRALLLAVTVETLLLGRYLRSAPRGPVWSMLLRILSFGGSTALPGHYNWLKNVAIYFRWNSRKFYHSAQQILKDLEDAWKLPSMDQGGLKEDILLAMRFLKFIYCQADWSKGLPDPDLNARSCRDHQFMVTYLQVALYAPLVR